MWFTCSYAWATETRVAYALHVPSRVIDIFTRWPQSHGHAYKAREKEKNTIQIWWKIATNMDWIGGNDEKEIYNTIKYKNIFITIFGVMASLLMIVCAFFFFVVIFLLFCVFFFLSMFLCQSSSRRIEEEEEKKISLYMYILMDVVLLNVQRRTVSDAFL